MIAAKTADPHPKLPGTIYTAAREIEAVGGQCLPCIVDVRDEKSIVGAVEKAVQHFGGIDVNPFLYLTHFITNNGLI